jgi:hypothetical protein
MSDLSDEFKNIWLKQANSIDMQQYEYCLNEWKHQHEKKMIYTLILTIILFGLGLWALYESIYFVAVILLIFAANFNLKSNQHILVTELMDIQRLSAMLINKQIQNIE